MVAVASKFLPAREGDYQRIDESDLILEGYIAFLDPPKETTAPALKALKAGRYYRQNSHRRQRAGGGQKCAMKWGWTRRRGGGERY